MPYQNDIPQLTDQLSVSQNDILENFSSIYTLIGVNHVQFDAVGQGKHKWVDFPVQSSNPAIISTDAQLFSKTSTITSNAEVFVQKIVAGPTTLAYGATSSDLNGAAGWSYFPSGLLMKWGTIAPGGSGERTLTFPVGATIPVFAATPFAILFIPNRNTATLPMQVAVYWDKTRPNSAAAISYFVSNFSGTAGSANTTLTYLAIGPQDPAGL